MSAARRYYVYAAATLAHLDPSTWAAAAAAAVPPADDDDGINDTELVVRASRCLLADIASAPQAAAAAASPPSAAAAADVVISEASLAAGGLDGGFTVARHKDWYEAHSWAQGLMPYFVGKSQESSSEAANGYYSAALYGAATGDARQRDFARVLLATEVRRSSLYKTAASTYKPTRRDPAALATEGMSLSKTATSMYERAARSGCSRPRWREAADSSAAWLSRARDRSAWRIGTSSSPPCLVTHHHHTHTTTITHNTSRHSSCCPSRRRRPVARAPSCAPRAHTGR